MPFARRKTYRDLRDPKGVDKSMDIIEFYNLIYSPDMSQFLTDLVMSRKEVRLPTCWLAAYFPSRPDHLCCHLHL
jgi:hypothetical protein